MSQNDDMISRQAAIDAVGNMLRRKFGIGGDLAEITIAGLPSAQSKQTASNRLQSLPTSPLLVGKMPSAQPEIIRCKDCKYYDGRPCGIVDWYNTADDFCSRAERREDED